MKLITILPVATVIGLVTMADAQTLPGPRVTVTISDDVQWHQVYGPDDGETLNGTPYLRELRLLVTPVSGSGTRTVSIPRAQITQVGEDLQATDIPVPIGSSTVTAAFVDGVGVMGVASTPIPFTSSRPPPAAPRNLRLVVQPQ